MSLKNFVAKALGIKAPVIPGNLYNQAIFKYLANKSVIWVDDDPKKYIDEGYYKNPDVYAAINVIVRLASTAPLNLYKVVDKKSLRAYKSLLNSIPNPSDAALFRKHIKDLHDFKTKALEEVFDHKILDRLEHPNEFQSKGEFLENFYGFKLATGEAIVYKARAKMGTPEIMALYHLPPQNTDIVSGGILEPIKKYKIVFSDEEGNFDPADIIHNRSWSLDYSTPGSHLRGISPLRSALRALTMGNDGRSVHTWMLQNKGSDKLIALDPDGLKLPGNQLTTEQKEALKDEVNSTVNGRQNKGKATFATGKFQVFDLGMSSQDLGIEAAIDLSTQDICKVYGISPILLANMDASTFANYKEAKKAAITQVVIPMLISVRDSLNKELLPEFEKNGNTFMLDYDLTAYPELQEDREKMVGYLKEAYWLSPNQKLIEMGYGEDTDPLMNKKYFPSSLVPIEQLNTNELMGDVNTNTGDY